MARISTEQERLRQAREEGIPWRKWGSYLSERQWGTVREDYSSSGDAWSYFSHDQARSRAYRWGEDGIGGFADNQMRLCLALGLWNKRDPILKERLFGLTNAEGNHGEDVKEYYFYLDGLPTHSYMKMLYKYPQWAFPYNDLVATNRSRSRRDFEYELLATGVFDADRYFDVYIEYAKETPEEILIRISVVNRAREAASLVVLPQLWFRNTWWRGDSAARPKIERAGVGTSPVLAASHPELGLRYLYCEGAAELLFTENETNQARVFGKQNSSPYTKDAFHEYLVGHRAAAVNPQGHGTKSAAVYDLTLEPLATKTLRVRFSERSSPVFAQMFDQFDAVFEQRRREADDFYTELRPAALSDDAAAVMRQGFAGMLWSKQAYIYDVEAWLGEHDAAFVKPSQDRVRNREWGHMASIDVISMPDKWEYPWFAAWDLAFHSITLAFVDPDFALEQLDLVLLPRYAHPNGQIPAYEWNFSDVNPPVQAWATIFNYHLQSRLLGDRALDGLRRAFHKLLVNFTWWVNRKDRDGRNVFEGGFLGLDNIGVFDRSAPLPTGGYLEQADGTAWMALFSQNMLEIAIELALHDPAYEDLAIKFYGHFIAIAAAMNRKSGERHGMWNEDDGLFYDQLRFPDGGAVPLKVHSLVSLLPLCATTVYPEEVLRRLPHFVDGAKALNERRPDLLRAIDLPARPGVKGRRMLALLDESKLRRVLTRMLDPAQFLSDYGIRSLSRYHADHPYVFYAGNDAYRVSYCPAESDSGLFGGNSNWRGPVWVPVNVLIIRALLQLYSFYGDDFKVECPVGSKRQMTLFEVSQEITKRLINIFLRNDAGRRPVHGGTTKFQEDPHWRDLLLFYEYFHGDNGAGLGASHQTGWTGLIAALIVFYGRITPQQFLEDSGSAFDRLADIRRRARSPSTAGVNTQ